MPANEYVGSPAFVGPSCRFDATSTGIDDGGGGAAALAEDGLSLALTVSCSLFNFTSSWLSGNEGSLWESSKGCGGYPYLTSKSLIDVWEMISEMRSRTWASSGSVMVEVPSGPRSRMRILGWVARGWLVGWLGGFASVGGISKQEGYIEMLLWTKMSAVKNF